MKRLALALLLAAMSVPAWAASGTLTTSGSTCTATGVTCLIVPMSQDKGAAGLTLSGTWTGTVTFEGSADGGVTWTAINALPLNSTTAVTSSTGNGTWQVNAAGLTTLRMRASATMSGSAIATITPSFASARSNGGGGGGGLPTGTGVVRVDSSAGTAGELSGFATTSGSNVLSPGSVTSGKTLTIASGGTLTCAAGSTCPSGGAMVNITATPTAAGCTVTSGACTVSGGSTTTVSFGVTGTAIPGTYNALKLVIVGRFSDTATLETANLTFNSDTGGDYDCGRIYGGFSSIGNDNSVNGSASMACAFFPAASAAANYPSQAEFYIPLYAGTTFYKTASIINGVLATNTAGQINNEFSSAAWRSTSAITSITITDGGGGHWLAGSTFYLYGIL